MATFVEEHDEELRELVKQEAVVAYEAHEELREEHPEAAALISPSDLLPKVDDALRWLRDRVVDDDSDEELAGSSLDVSDDPLSGH